MFAELNRPALQPIRDVSLNAVWGDSVPALVLHSLEIKQQRYACHVEAQGDATGRARRQHCSPTSKGPPDRGQKARPRPEPGGCRVQEDAVSRRKFHRGGPARPMRTLSRRLRKLEDCYRIGPEREFDRQLRERIAAARRRLAEFASWEGSHPSSTACEDLSGLTMEEILHRGRMRNAATIDTDNPPLTLFDSRGVSPRSAAFFDNQHHEEHLASIPAADPTHARQPSMRSPIAAVVGRHRNLV